MRERQRAFTLLEVMISSAILVSAIIAGFAVYMSGAKHVKIAQERDNAYFVLQQMGESLLNIDFDYLLNRANSNHMFSFAFDGTGDNQSKQGEDVITNKNPGDLLDHTPYIKEHFDPHGLKGSVFVYLNVVPGSENNLIDAHIVLCYESNGQVLGEDKNLNAWQDWGEDTNSNGHIDSSIDSSGNCLFELDLSISRIGT